MKPQLLNHDPFSVCTDGKNTTALRIIKGRYQLKLISIFMLVLLTQGCLAHKWQVIDSGVPDNTKEDKKPTFTIIDAIEGLEIEPFSFPLNYFKIKNHTNLLVFIDHNSSVAELNEKSYRVVPKDTKTINSDRKSPRIPVGPGTSTDVGLIPLEGEVQHQVMYRGATFRIAIVKENQTQYITVLTEGFYKPEPNNYNGATFITRANLIDRVGCYFTGLLYGGWCWFAHPKKTDYEKAEKFAQSEYGEHIQVKFIDRVEWRNKPRYHDFSH